MSKKKKNKQIKDKTVKSINKNVRSSVRKLNPILKGIVGKTITFEGAITFDRKDKIYITPTLLNLSD